jgi:hypothetical protein
MLLNYYGAELSVGVTNIGAFLIAVSFILGVVALLVDFKVSSLTVISITTLLPILLAFFNKIEMSTYNQLAIEQQALFNQYIVMTGVVGGLAACISILRGLMNRFFPYKDGRSLKL